MAKTPNPRATPQKSATHPRIQREKTTVAAMVRIHCRNLHGTGQLPCPDCAELADYAWVRLDRCPFQEDKPTCAQCRIHCYRPAMREKVKAVMRYAGPRMLLRHPVLALYHLLDGRRKRPVSVSPRQDRR